MRSGVQLSNRDKEVGKDMVYQVSIAALQTSPNLSILKQYPFIADNSMGQEILAGLGRDGQVHSCSSVHLGLGEAISPTWPTHMLGALVMPVSWIVLVSLHWPFSSCGLFFHQDSLEFFTCWLKVARKQKGNFQS